MMKDVSNENVIHIQKKGVSYLQFRRLLEYPEIKHCFTLKPMDFGMYRNYEEKRDEIEQNLKTLGEMLEFHTEDVCRPKQTHTDRVEVIGKEDAGIYCPKFDDIDGFITNVPQKVLMVSFADCTPLFFYDPVRKVIGNTHSGWKGTLQRIGVKTVRKMKEVYGCQPQDILCCIGPHIRRCHFEVDQDVKDLFVEEFKDLNSSDSWLEYDAHQQKYHIDTAMLNKQILQGEGLQEKNIVDSNICTVCDVDICHSFRVEKELSGRSVSMIELL